MYVCVYVIMYVCRCLCVCMYVYMYMYVCMYIYVYSAAAVYRPPIQRHPRLPPTATYVWGTEVMVSSIYRHL